MSDEITEELRRRERDQRGEGQRDAGDLAMVDDMRRMDAAEEG